MKKTISYILVLGILLFTNSSLLAQIQTEDIFVENDFFTDVIDTSNEIQAPFGDFGFGFEEEETIHFGHDEDDEVGSGPVGSGTIILLSSVLFYGAIIVIRRRLDLQEENQN